MGNNCPRTCLCERRRDFEGDRGLQQELSGLDLDCACNILNDAKDTVSKGHSTMKDSEQIEKLTPFLKWPGGKRWLVEQRPDIFPSDFRLYIEPFLGGGSVFFFLQPKHALLSDINRELVDAYSAIRDSCQAVVQGLSYYHRIHSARIYYKTRAAILRSPVSRAIRFIYLNRTCFNGIYRVNTRGQFNVPIGSKESVIMPTDNFPKVSAALQNARISSCDFADAIARARRDDFVFIDPPYTVKHSNNGFLKYNEVLFSWPDQVRLRDAVQKAKERGAKLLILNAPHKSIKELYGGFGRIDVLKRNSLISGKPGSRGVFEELAIRSYA